MSGGSVLRCRVVWFVFDAIGASNEIDPGNKDQQVDEVGI